MKRAISLFLAMIMVLTVVPFAGAAARGFSDVPRNHWAYKEIMDMAERGIIVGYNDGKFRPNNRVTRAEFAKIMIAAADVDIDKRSVKQTFQDVPRSHWAFYYVEYAKPYLTGYKSGNRYNYKPDQPAVREDIAVAMVRLLGLDKKEDADLDELNKFRDEDDISPNLRSYIAIAVETGLMKGSNNYFRPQDPITRAEAASLLHRALIERDGDEDKIVFPNPNTPTPDPEPELPDSVYESFSDRRLNNWLTDDALGIWGVVEQRITAGSNDNDLEHFFLPLKWKESTEPKKYELAVDVDVDRTEGLAGLYFNGTDDEAHVVYLDEDRVILGKVSDAEDDEVDVIASAKYELRSKNRLKVVVDGSSVAIYMNDQYLFGNQQVKQEGTKLGLYMQKGAIDEAPRRATYLDNFSFVARR